MPKSLAEEFREKARRLRSKAVTATDAETHRDLVLLAESYEAEADMEAEKERADRKAG
jgi:hypothetical protein